MHTYYGTRDSDTLSSANWNYNWNAFAMGDGDDFVSTPSTGVSYQFRGGNGNDYFLGDSSFDSAYGEAGDDTLNGYSGGDLLDGGTGNDRLYGGSGNDSLFGGAGNDHIHGGTGSDSLFGGSGYDRFHIVKGESNAVTGQADTIHDWDVRYDYIDSSIAGTASNYGEGATNYTNISDARWLVEHSALRFGDHAFLYNPWTDTGYLLSDLDRNFTFETGVVIHGAGSASDMNWSDIV